MLLGLLIDDRVAGEDLLEALPQAANSTVHLLRLVLGELPGDIQAIESVGLYQRVDGVHETSATCGALEQLEILVGQLLGILVQFNVLVTTHTQQDLDIGILALQAGHRAVKSLAQIQIQLLVQTHRLVRIALDSGIAVDQIVAELQSRFQFIDYQLAQT